MEETGDSSQWTYKNLKSYLPKAGKQIADHDLIFGSKIAVKKVYAVPSKECSCCMEWVDKMPAQDKEAAVVEAQKADRDSYSILQRQTRHGGDNSWTTHSIEANSPTLCAFISKCLENYPWERFSKRKIVLCPPYEALFHRREVLQNAIKKESNTNLKRAFKLLFAILDVDWKPYFEALEEFASSGLITYEAAWTLFPPDELLVSEDEHGTVLGKLQKFEPGGYGIDLACTVIDFNGQRSGFREVPYCIPNFNGLKKIGDLNVYPLRFHHNPDGLKTRLVARGRRFEQLRGFHVKGWSAPESRLYSRIVIDAYAFLKFQNMEALKLQCTDDSKPRKDDPKRNAIESVFDHHHTGWQPNTVAEESSKDSESSDTRKENLSKLTDDECLLALPYVRGFDLQSKKWDYFGIDQIVEVKWNENAFDQLVLDGGQKRLIHAFAKHKLVENSEFDDFISGKGKGIVMLLCGPPGVGKTLTAESTADNLKAPLYYLGAGDLGSDPKQVEISLKKALDLCALWKAVMLIDEADVFMEKREANSLKRNELVAVFLRLIEYYEGIMFLTTNRVEGMDPAFKSRIDLIIPYSELDKPARRQVWSTFVRTLPADLHTLKDEDYDILSDRECNGREIKSMVKTGLILAKSEEAKLRREHLEVVLQIREQAGGLMSGGNEE